MREGLTRWCKAEDCCTVADGLRGVVYVNGLHVNGGGRERSGLSVNGGVRYRSYRQLRLAMTYSVYIAVVAAATQSTTTVCSRLSILGTAVATHKTP